jgi:hypothetical protein
MLFKMSSLAFSRSPMKVELRLDQAEPAYTCQDKVSGEVTLKTESPADLSTIFLKLSGTATSRLTQSRRTETHNVCGKVTNHCNLIFVINNLQLFQKSYRLFPSDHLMHLMHDSNTSSVTIGSGNHILRFSITVSTNQEIRTSYV